MIAIMLNNKQSDEEMINITNHVTDSPAEKTGNNPIRHNNNVCSSSLLATLLASLLANDLINPKASNLLPTSLLASSLIDNNNICYTLISQINYNVPITEASVIPNSLLNQILIRDYLNLSDNSIVNILLNLLFYDDLSQEIN